MAPSDRLDLADHHAGALRTGAHHPSTRHCSENSRPGRALDRRPGERDGPRRARCTGRGRQNLGATAGREPTVPAGLPGMTLGPTHLLGLLDTANRTGPRKSPRPLSPTSRCDKSVTTRPAAVITGRPAPRGESPVQRLVSACERDARPPSTDVRVTTRRELVAAIRASDSGQNTQVRAGFAPGKDAAIPGRR